MAAVAPHQVGLRREAVVHDARRRACTPVAPFTYLIGMSFSSSQDLGTAVRSPTSYSIGPILAVPGGTIDVLRQQRVDDVLRRQAARVERVGVEVDVHDARSCRRTGAEPPRPAPSPAACG